MSAVAVAAGRAEKPVALLEPAEFPPVLLHPAAPPAVSLFLPADGAVDGHARALLEDLVDEASATLRNRYEHREYRDVDRSLAGLAEHPDSIKGTVHGGLAVYASGTGLFAVDLFRKVAPRAVVGEDYALRPLLEGLQLGSQYLLLGLSTDRFALIKGTPSFVERVPLPPGAHGAFSELFDVYDGTEAALDYPSLENHLPPYHGHRSRNDVKKEEAAKFFRYVDKVVAEDVLRGAGLPVILVSLPEHQAMFRKLSTIPGLLPEGIDQPVESLDGKELLAQATCVLDRARARQAAALAASYGAQKAEGRATADPAEIGLALVERKVGALIVDEGLALPGSFDPVTGSVQVGTADGRPVRRGVAAAGMGRGEASAAWPVDDAAADAVADQASLAAGEPVAGDLADAFALAALRQDAAVTLVAHDQMPEQAAVAAIFRY